MSHETLHLTVDVDRAEEVPPPHHPGPEALEVEGAVDETLELRKAHTQTVLREPAIGRRDALSSLDLHPAELGQGFAAARVAADDVAHHDFGFATETSVGRLAFVLEVRATPTLEQGTGQVLRCHQFLLYRL